MLVVLSLVCHKLQIVLENQTNLLTRQWPTRNVFGQHMMVIHERVSSSHVWRMLGYPYMYLSSFSVQVVLVNDDIDRMRHSATRSLLERRDVIVVASASLDEAVVCALMRIHSAATVASTSLNDGHRLVQAIGRTNKITQGMVLLARQVTLDWRRESLRCG